VKREEKHKHIRGRGLVSASALGLADGLITNLAFLSGFAGGVSDISLIRFAGVAAILAGSVSMFFGGILAERSEHDLFKADSRREAYEIKNERDEEIAELKNMYIRKGLSEKEASLVVDRISSDDGKFLEDMLTNELHIHESVLQSPYVYGTVIGLSFLLGALVPVVPYYIFTSIRSSLEFSVVVSLAFLFGAGVWKGRIAQGKAWRSGLETLMVGAIASAILYLIGSTLGFV
jgi:predicted membrane protein (TIGR00267 family)